MPLPEIPTHVACEARLALAEATVIEPFLRKIARMAARGVLLVPAADQDELQAALNKLVTSINQRSAPWID